MDAQTRFRAWRAARQLTQIQAGELLGVNQATIHRLETGVTFPTRLLAHAIERATAGHEIGQIRAEDWDAMELAARDASEPDGDPDAPSRASAA